MSALRHWGGCTEDGMITGGSDQPDDYDRACEVEDLAEVIGLRGHGDVSALVLGDEPTTTCYLPEQRAFMRWLAADSDAELLAAETALNDPATPWEECGLWETDGPTVLMDSAEAGKNLGMPYPNGRGEPDQAPVHLPAGRRRIRAFHCRAAASSPASSHNRQGGPVGRGSTAYVPDSVSGGRSSSQAPWWMWTGSATWDTGAVRSVQHPEHANTSKQAPPAAAPRDCASPPAEDPSDAVDHECVGGGWFGQGLGQSRGARVRRLTRGRRPARSAGRGRR
ncbi:Imm21 family immunity protein [Kitasatospora sp. NPDC054795]